MQKPAWMLAGKLSQDLKAVTKIRNNGRPCVLKLQECWSLVAKGINDWPNKSSLGQIEGTWVIWERETSSTEQTLPTHFLYIEGTWVNSQIVILVL